MKRRNADIARALKKASAQASSKYTIGGKPKRIQPKPVTLPRLKCLQEERQ